MIFCEKSRLFLLFFAFSKKYLQKAFFYDILKLITAICKRGGNIMSAEYSIPLSKIEQEFKLEKIVVPENYEDIKKRNYAKP